MTSVWNKWFSGETEVLMTALQRWPGAVLLMDEELNIQWSNDRTAELFAQPAAQLSGKPLSEFLGTQRQPQLRRLLKRLIQPGNNRSLTLRRVSHQGELCSLQIFAVPLSDQHNSGPVVVLLNDLTDDFRRMEVIFQRQKMQALTRMAGHFAHHFNNLLGSLVTTIDFARHAPDAPTLRRTLTSCNETLQRAVTLVNEILAFAEADYRQGDLADLTETLLYVLQDYQDQITHRQIELEVRLGETPVVEIPRQQLMAVFGHVIRNALEALPQGGRLVVESWSTKQWYHCRVIDFGSGIPYHLQPHIFDPFFSTKQGLREPTDQRNHYGLGLSVVRGIVHELGGDVALQSIPGQSTSVEIKIPIHHYFDGKS
ncbi:MAG: Adaptive-response sensory-kinase SasA [Phycisphaerae bacterium]|nr:Adaptive-response sensory-kinase SasA [Phycisphaerae bacterium]